MSVLVVHTTETPAGTARSVARQLMAKGRAPHQVYDPADGTLVHCHDWDSPAAALKNLYGGVETNRRGGVYQVEVVGRAADVPGYSDVWYGNLGRYLGSVCDWTGTPKVFPYRFTGPDGYGQQGTVRLSFEQWQTVAGIVGHAHVPENTHWDPGALDVARLLPHMQPAQQPPTEEKRAVEICPTPSGGGYWICSTDGSVYAFGDAPFHGSLPGLGVTPAAPIVSMAATPDGGGYWLLGADGGVFCFGNATMHGTAVDYI